MQHDERGILRTLIDLVVPDMCPGCGAPGSLCGDCAAELKTLPQPIAPKISVPVPTWISGPYAGPRQSLVLAAKEQHSTAAMEAIGAVVGACLGHLIASGQLAHPLVQPLVLVPAPTRRSASRRRGGDPVTHVCRYAATYLSATWSPSSRGGDGGERSGKRPKNDHVMVKPVLRTSEEAKDSAGLSARSRRANLSGKIVVNRTDLSKVLDIVPGGCSFVLVDDVITTGTTVAESTLVLASVGIRTDLVLAFTQA